LLHLKHVIWDLSLWSSSSGCVRLAIVVEGHFIIDTLIPIDDIHEYDTPLFDGSSILMASRGFCFQLGSKLYAAVTVFG
jgi:hypothetical protein